MKHPLQIAYCFKPGHFQNPRVKGATCQTVVKTFHPDGSAFHAIFDFSIEGNPGDKIPIEFEDGPTTELSPFTLGCTVEMNGQTVDLSVLPATKWLPNANIHAAHSGAADIPSPSGTKARPIIHITYFPEVQNAFVRFILENSSTTTAGECLANNARFLINGVERWSNVGQVWQQQMIPLAGRLTKSFWLNGPPKVFPKFDLSYLRGWVLPNYEMGVQVADSTIAGVYNSWLTSDKNIANKASNQWGLFAKSMGTAGARADLGPFPTWTTLWLYSGDPRMLEVDQASTELAAMFPLHYRESDPARASYQRPVRVTDRPSLFLKSPLANADGVDQAADMDSWGLVPDVAHLPQPHFCRYLFGGEFFHLEQMHFWSSYAAGYPNGAAVNGPGGRGPTGREGGLPGSNGANGQIRSQGWMFLDRIRTALLTPDSMSEKAYFHRLALDAIEIWEGGRQISSVGPLRQWGASRDPQLSPLGLWEYGNGGLVGHPVDWQKASFAISPWEVSIWALAMITAKQYGYPVQPLIDWQSRCAAPMKKYLAAYRIGTRKDNNYFNDWPEVFAAYYPDFDVDAWWNQNLNLDHGYTLMAAMQVILSGDPALWQWYVTEARSKINYTSNPKWNILP